MMTSFAQIDIGKVGVEGSVQILEKMIRNLRLKIIFSRDQDEYKITEMLIEEKELELKKLKGVNDGK